MQDQLLDSMDLERERGITIKAHPVTMLYKAKNGETYELNLIDTPGHVDFSYEVSRSLSACEGALLIDRRGAGRRGADGRQRASGDEAESDDHPGDQQDRSAARGRAAGEAAVGGYSGDPGGAAILASAKEGIGIEEILEAIVERIPPPKPTGAQRCRRWCSIRISTLTKAS